MNNYEIAYCAFVETAAKMLKTAGIDIVGNPFLSAIAESQLKKYDPQIKKLLGYVVSDPPTSIDVSAAMLSEKANGAIKDFGEELKLKIRQSKQKSKPAKKKTGE